jgi:hypothetical protein
MDEHGGHLRYGNGPKNPLSSDLWCRTAIPQAYVVFLPRAAASPRVTVGQDLCGQSWKTELSLL